MFYTLQIFSRYNMCIHLENFVERQGKIIQLIEGGKMSIFFHWKKTPFT